MTNTTYPQMTGWEPTRRSIRDHRRMAQRVHRVAWIVVAAIAIGLMGAGAASALWRASVVLDAPCFYIGTTQPCESGSP